MADGSGGERVRITYDWTTAGQLDDFDVYSGSTASIAIVADRLVVTGLSGEGARAAILQHPIRVDRVQIADCDRSASEAFNVFLSAVFVDTHNPATGYDFVVRPSDYRVFWNGADNNLGGPGIPAETQFDVDIITYPASQSFTAAARTENLTETYSDSTARDFCVGGYLTTNDTASCGTLIIEGLLDASVDIDDLNAASVEFLETSGPQITVHGDSSMDVIENDGTEGRQNCFINIVESGQLNYNMLAVGGRTAADIAATHYPNDQRDVYMKGGDIFFFQAGGNDIILEGTSASDTYDEVLDVWTQAATDGYYVVAYTLPPSNVMDAAAPGVRAAFNALVLGGTVRDIVVDLGSLAALSDPDDDTIYVDGLHLTALGAWHVAQETARVTDVTMKADRFLVGHSWDTSSAVTGDVTNASRYEIQVTDTLRHLEVFALADGVGKFAIYEDDGGDLGSPITPAYDVSLTAGWNSIPVSTMDVVEGDFLWIVGVSPTAILSDQVRAGGVNATAAYTYSEFTGQELTGLTPGAGRLHMFQAWGSTDDSGNRAAIINNYFEGKKMIIRLFQYEETGAISRTITIGDDFHVPRIDFNFSSAPTTAGSITVTRVTAVGAEYNTVVATVDPVGETSVSIVDLFGFAFGDSILITYSNADSRTIRISASIGI